MLLKFLFKKEKEREEGEMEESRIFEINELLKSKSLNKMDKDKTLGCSRRAFCNQASKLGYKFNGDLKQFVKDDSVTKVTRPRKAESKIIVNDLEAKIKDLEERLQKVEGIIELNKIKESSIDFKPIFPLNDDEIVSRSVKISKKALNEFKGLSKGKLAQYKQQDLISQALLEFVEKYK